jgi:hypothetical protein
MYGVWNPEYVFSLLPVGLEKVDVLDSQMRDIQEECGQLRAHVAELLEASRCKDVAFLSVSSVAACAQNQIVTWNAEAPREITASHFALSDDNKQVTIRVAGVYQVQVRLAVTNSGNSYHTVVLKVNDEDVAGCIQSDANGYQNTPQLFEMMRLQASDVLQVQCGANSGSLTVATANRFTVTYLGH